MKLFVFKVLVELREPPGYVSPLLLSMNNKPIRRATVRAKSEHEARRQVLTAYLTVGWVRVLELRSTITY
jgi:hypothetical protein